MKSSLVFFLSLASLVCFSQKGGTIKVKKKNNVRVLPDTTSVKSLAQPNNTVNANIPFSFYCGYQHISLSDLNTVNETEKKFSNERVIYGFQLSYPAELNNTGIIYGNIRYARIYPEEIKSDTETYILSGYHWNLLNTSVDFFEKVRWLDLNLAGGFCYGRLKLMQNEKKYTNPFVALHAQGELRFNVNSLLIRGVRYGIGIKSGYLYDLTNPNWKNKNNNSPVLPGTRVTGFYNSLMLSIVLG